MLIIIHFLCLFSLSLSLNDVAIGIWTGVEVFSERVVSLSQTWMKLVPEIHVYSDQIPYEQVVGITHMSPHLNITFHEIPIRSHYLIGTQFEGKWNSVQSRHLFAIIDLVKRCPDKEWYVLGDDDTYFFPEAMINFLNSKNSSEYIIYGQPFFAFEHINRFFPNPHILNVFVQGGAGILIPKVIMNLLIPLLPMCAEIYTGVNFASDMRLSACLQRFLNFTNDVFKYHSGLHGDTPYNSIAKECYACDPISFHHVVPPITEKVWFASCSVWKCQNGTDLYIDWNSIAFTELSIQLGCEGYSAEIQWGFCIYLDNRDRNRLHSITQLEPIFQDDDTELMENPRSFIQKYEKGIVMKLVCDDSLNENDLIFDSFLLDKEGSIFRTKCPKPRQFIHNFHNGTSPIQITYEKEIEI